MFAGVILLAEGAFVPSEIELPDADSRPEQNTELGANSFFTEKISRRLTGNKHSKTYDNCRISSGAIRLHVPPGSARPGCGFTDDDGVFVGGQTRDGDGEFFSINFLVKSRRIVVRAFNGQRRIVFAMRKLPADAYFLSIASAGFVSRKCGGSRKPDSSRQQEQHCLG